MQKAGRDQVSYIDTIEVIQNQLTHDDQGAPERIGLVARIWETHIEEAQARRQLDLGERW